MRGVPLRVKLQYHGPQHNGITAQRFLDVGQTVRQGRHYLPGIGAWHPAALAIRHDDIIKPRPAGVYILVAVSRLTSVVLVNAPGVMVQQSSNLVHAALDVRNKTQCVAHLLTSFFAPKCNSVHFLRAAPSESSLRQGDAALPLDPLAGGLPSYTCYLQIDRRRYVGSVYLFGVRNLLALPLLTVGIL